MPLADESSLVAHEVIRRRFPDWPEAVIADFFSPSLIEATRRVDDVPHLDAAAQIMLSHVIAGSGIVLFGDYDADGVCSLSSIGRVLDALGVPPSEVLVPDRLADGHGLSASAVDRLVAAPADLLVVLDCGTTSVQALERLAGYYADIVVLDHHGMNEPCRPALPDNVVLLNPAIEPDARVRQDWGIACTGVLAYLLGLHIGRLWRRRPARPATPTDADLKDMLHDCLGLGAITAVADMVPLLGINRAVVRHGLRYSGDLPGIIAIAGSLGRLGVVKKALRPDQITAEDVGFRYGPILNAAGRIAHGSTAIALMRGRVVDDLVDVANEAVAINLRRRDVQADVVETCLARLEAVVQGAGERRTGILVRDPDFHPGVVGLAASRLLETTGRPAIVIGAGGAGSGRSVPGFNIGDFVRAGVEGGLLAKGGGHAGAAGFTLADAENPESHLDLARMFELATEGVVRADPLVDLSLTGGGPAPDFLRVYRELAPFGMGFPALRVRIDRPVIQHQKWFGANRNHWKGILVFAGASIEGVMFGTGASNCPAIRDLGMEKRDIGSGAPVVLLGTLRGQFDTYFDRFVVNVIVDTIFFETEPSQSPSGDKGGADTSVFQVSGAGSRAGV